MAYHQSNSYTNPGRARWVAVVHVAISPAEEAPHLPRADRLACSEAGTKVILLLLHRRRTTDYQQEGTSCE